MASNSDDSPNSIQLFILGPVGILIGVPIGAILFSLAFFVTTVLELPFVLFWAMKATCYTGRLGPFAKFVMLLLALPLLAILALILSPFVGAIVGIGDGGLIGFELLSCATPIPPCCVISATMVGYVAYTAGATRDYSKHLLEEELPSDYKRFELNPFQLVIGLLGAALGAVVGFVWFAICALIFAIPNVIGIYRGLCKLLCSNPQCMCFCAVCALVTILLIPFLYLFVMILDPIVGFVMGFITPLCAVFGTTLSFFKEDEPESKLEEAPETNKEVKPRSIFSGMKRQVSQMLPDKLTESGKPLIDKKPEDEKSDEKSGCDSLCNCCRCFGDFFGLTGIPPALMAIWELCCKRWEFGSNIVYVTYADPKELFGDKD